jgi:hypothetical protein
MQFTTSRSNKIGPENFFGEKLIFCPKDAADSMYKPIRQKKQTKHFLIVLFYLPYMNKRNRKSEFPGKEETLSFKMPEMKSDTCSSGKCVRSFYKAPVRHSIIWYAGIKGVGCLYYVAIFDEASCPRLWKPSQMKAYNLLYGVGGSGNTNLIIFQFNNKFHLGF